MVRPSILRFEALRSAAGLAKPPLNVAWPATVSVPRIDQLPGTAATPAQRAEYVRKLAASEDPATRAFAVKAAQKMLGRMQHEVITVSGELQGPLAGWDVARGSGGSHRK